MVVEIDDAIEALSQAEDSVLRAGLLVLNDVLRDRARERGDLDALMEVGFEEGFTSSGHAKAPWVVSGVIICPGSGVEKSASKHECSYVNVDGSWVWESPEMLLHEIRRIPAGARSHQRTISLLDARDGLGFDVLRSKMSLGVHQLQGSSSYSVIEGDLVLVSTRAVKARDHR